MKKLIGLFICLFMLLPISCSGEDNKPIEPPTDNPDPIPNPDPTPGEDDEIPPSIADSSFYYYNKAFLLEKNNSKDGLTYYRENQTSNHWAYFWNQALIILMVEDRYECRKDESLKPLLTNLLDAFRQHEKNPQTNDIMDWTWNDFQDDLLWAGLAFIRGYQITGNERFLEQAKWDWEFLYNRGYDTALGGGLWWSIDKADKSGLSNNPAISMACYLYEATGNQTYLDQAKDIYNWVYTTLREPNGAVDEKISKDGVRPRSYNVYNVGAFIEAANALYRITKNEIYAQHAKESIQFVMRDKVDENGIMSKWHRDGTWQSEFARGMGLFVKDNNLWDYQADYTSERKPITYYEWMRKNAIAAWETRERVNNITFNEWAKQTPLIPETGKTWTAMEMVSAVVMTQVTPDEKP
ncbi:glycoside hydrolase family 76 protein [Bacteroides sp.]|uniref:glycoside hydrolase family 76 protein n=1 Tax=Bacteroides sp. TaxID=29523 RepID=UPI00402596A9